MKCGQDIGCKRKHLEGRVDTCGCTGDLHPLGLWAMTVNRSLSHCGVPELIPLAPLSSGSHFVLSIPSDLLYLCHFQ